MNQTKPSIRLGADIGGTFTDVVLDVGGRITSAKVLTTHGSPEQAIFEGIDIVTRQAEVAIGSLEVVVHGTTLATNALIERRGAKTALVTTEGFRDVIEMRTESRFEQYDLNIALPPPLIPRKHRFCVSGRLDASGRELLPLDEDRLVELAERLRQENFQAVAIGFLHSYVNPAHEQRARDLLASRLPGVSISISAEVSPQVRELERFNTVCANAYVRPQMESYLQRFRDRLRTAGARCPLYMIHSGGGLISVETAMQFPVRLVESGPAGGAIFAAGYAAQFGLKKALSFDMGGTTAKICLIDDAAPRTSRSFEVARTYRFKKGSGMAITIPVIDMVEIGAGGGSLASIDALGRIQVGPESAGSEPGPACYQRGGLRPAVTDADLVLGKIDPHGFAGGEMILAPELSAAAVARDVGAALSIEATEAAFGICEMVDENMANAARVHAVENGRDIAEYSMIAFGGAAPLHAARLCEKLGIKSCFIPQGAGVGSAIGFLRAPFSYEAVASRLIRISTFNAGELNALMDDLRRQTVGFLASSEAREEVEYEITGFARYAGQGWEIPVPLPAKSFVPDDAVWLADRFRTLYGELFGRPIDSLGDLEIEFVTWSLKASSRLASPERVAEITGETDRSGTVTRSVFDGRSAAFLDHHIVDRPSLAPGDTVPGPAVITERETSTVVSSSFAATVQRDGTILLSSKEI